MNTETDKQKDFDPAKIVDLTLVEHTAFLEAYATIDQAFHYSATAIEATYIGVVGESGSGKTRLMECFYDKHLPYRTGEQRFAPILRVSVPPSPTVKSFLATLLEAIEDPRAHHGSKHEMESRLKKLMHEAGTRMLMVDEFQQFVETKSDQRIVDTSNTLKRLVDDTKVVLVATGIDSFIGVLKDTQLKTRFNSMIRMPTFDWNQPEQRKEFVDSLECFHSSLSKHFSLPELHGASMSFRCFYATQGIFRLLIRFLRQAVQNALDMNTTHITLEDLARAYRQTLLPANPDTVYHNPFDKSFQSYEDLLVAGTSPAQSKEKTPSLVRTDTSLSVRTLNQILSKR